MPRGFQVADNLTEADLTLRVRTAIAGPGAGVNTDIIVWHDRGAEVVVHLASLQVRLIAPTILAAVDLESDQTGRAPLIVRFLFGNAQDPAGLFATSDEVVRGHSQLAARWGPIFRDLVWSALMRLSRDHAVERGLAPLGITVENGSMQLSASDSIPLPDRVHTILTGPPTPPPKPPPHPHHEHEDEDEDEDECEDHR